MATVVEFHSRMTGLIDTLLDVTRLQMGQPLPLDECPTDLVGLALQVVEEQQRTTDRHQLRLEAYAPASGVCRLEVICGAGTYVRSLAHDLGARLGSGAYLRALTRTAVGPLHLADAVRLEALVGAGDGWERWLLPMDLPLRGWPALVLDADRALAVSHGRAIPAPEATGTGRHRLLDQTGRLLAWGTVDPGGSLQPRAVFPP